MYGKSISSKSKGQISSAEKKSSSGTDLQVAGNVASNHHTGAETHKKNFAAAALHQNNPAKQSAESVNKNEFSLPGERESPKKISKEVRQIRKSPKNKSQAKRKAVDGCGCGGHGGKKKRNKNSNAKNKQSRIWSSSKNKENLKKCKYQR